MILELLIAAMSPTAPGDVESLVSSLGPHSDYRSVEEIGRHGCRALPALVRQLEIVPADRVPRHDQELYPREMRVVWSIAALRHITNTDLHAPRPSSFDPESQGGQALSLGAPPDSTKFFAIGCRGGSTILPRRPSNGRSWHNGADSMRPVPADELDRILTSLSG